MTKSIYSKKKQFVSIIQLQQSSGDPIIRGDDCLNKKNKGCYSSVGSINFFQRAKKLSIVMASSCGAATSAGVRASGVRKATVQGQIRENRAARDGAKRSTRVSLRSKLTLLVGRERGAAARPLALHVPPCASVCCGPPLYHLRRSKFIIITALVIP